MIPLTLSLIGLVEVVVAMLLLAWRHSLKYERQWIDREQHECYACITGASVTSFSTRVKFCRKHLAHWVLIRDLEEQERKALG